MPNANGSQQERNDKAWEEFLEFLDVLRGKRPSAECPMPEDKVWQQFLDVLTGKRPESECPTLEELELECLHDLYEEVNGDA